MIPLYEAIALGSLMIRPQSGGSTDSDNGCAMDMALAAIGQPGRHWADAIWTWEWLERPGRLNSECRYFTIKDGVPWLSLIAITFDNIVMGDRKWSLSRFIDWVKEIELRETAPIVESIEVSNPSLVEEPISIIARITQ